MGAVEVWEAGGGTVGLKPAPTHWLWRWVLRIHLAAEDLD